MKERPWQPARRMVRCRWCDGAGHHACPYCEGDGGMHGIDWTHPGLCEACDGTGEVECRDCDGIGVNLT